jgi:hypothetical protein
MSLLRNAIRRLFLIDSVAAVAQRDNFLGALRAHGIVHRGLSASRLRSR